MPEPFDAEGGVCASCKVCCQLDDFRVRRRLRCEQNGEGCDRRQLLCSLTLVLSKKKVRLIVRYRHSGTRGDEEEERLSGVAVVAGSPGNMRVKVRS